MKIKQTDEQYVKYDIAEYDFQKLFVELFESKFEVNDLDLENLHKLIPTESYKHMFQVSKDSSTKLHDVFYAKLNDGWDEFSTLYRKFVREVVVPLLPEGEKRIIIQRSPTFRAHLPGNIAVGGFHKDRDYNHPVGEYNFMLPITNATDSACTITESAPGKMDFHQLSFKKGSLIYFNGNECTHGNLPNQTGRTRVSFDFRILLEKDYTPEKAKHSVTTSTSFVVGNYYEYMEL